MSRPILRKSDNEGKHWMRIALTPEQHRRLSEAARLDNRTKRSFATKAVIERIDAYVDDNLESPFFIPPGLR